MEMVKTGFKFEWGNGCLNDNAIKIFKKYGVQWRYEYQRLTIDFFRNGKYNFIEFDKIDDNDIFEICVIMGV